MHQHHGRKHQGKQGGHRGNGDEGGQGGHGGGNQGKSDLGQQMPSGYGSDDYPIVNMDYGSGDKNSQNVPSIYGNDASSDPLIQALTKSGHKSPKMPAIPSTHETIVNPPWA